MIINLVPPPPKGKLLKWVLKNPSAANDYFHAVYALSRLKLRLTINGETREYVVSYDGREAVIIIDFVLTGA